MKAIVAFIIIWFCAACNTNEPTSRINQIDTVSKSQYSDSFIANEESKAIGNIFFGISEKQYPKEETTFNKTTERKDVIVYHYIGNFNYFRIQPYFYEDKLYKIELTGHISMLDYNSEASTVVNEISKVIELKYGIPTKTYPIPEILQMDDKHIYTIKTWEIGKKRISIQMRYNGTFFEPTLSSYQYQTDEVIKQKYMEQNDSIIKTGKDVL